MKRKRAPAGGGEDPSLCDGRNKEADEEWTGNTQAGGVPQFKSTVLQKASF